MDHDNAPPSEAQRPVFTDLDDTAGEVSGETFTFDYAGATYTFETWSTRHGSGADFYCNGTPVPCPFANDAELADFQTRTQALSQAYWERLNPLKQDAVEQALAVGNSPTELRTYEVAVWMSETQEMRYVEVPAVNRQAAISAAYDQEPAGSVTEVYSPDEPWRRHPERSTPASRGPQPDSPAR